MNNILRFVIGKSPSGLSPLKCAEYSGGSMGGSSSPALAAALQVFGGMENMMSNWFNSEQVRQTNQMNYDIAYENNETQKAIAAANNALQVQMMRENNQFAHDEALAAWQRQIEWANPLNQVKLLSEAGINPSVYFGGSSSMPSAGSSTPASPHGSGISPSMPNLHNPTMIPFQMVNPSQSFKELAEGFQAVGNAGKLGVETHILSAEAEDLIRRVHAQGDLGELEVEYKKKLLNQKDKELEQINMSICEASYRCLKLAAEHDYIKANEQLAILKQKSEVQEAKVKGEEYERLHAENMFIYDMTKAKLDNIRSSTSKNYSDANASDANARLTNERASQLEDMHEDNVNMQKWLTKKAEANATLSDMERESVERTLERKISYLNKHYGNMQGIEKKQYELAVEALKEAKLNNDYYHYKLALQTIQSTLGLAIQAEKANAKGYTKTGWRSDDGSYYEEYEPWNE